MTKKKCTIILMITIALASLLVSETTFAYNQTVYDVQKKLTELGYEPGPTDGIWGNQTEVAVKTFQQDYGLPITGRLTKKTLKTLGLTESTKDSLPSTIKRISSSVVVILTYDKEGKAIGRGSGFFVNKEGHVITNRHVIQGANRAEVKTSEGKIYPIKEVLAEDKEGDIVLLSVAIPLKKVRLITISELLPEVGEQVVVIGNPLGLEQTVSEGIVSAVRQIPGFGNIVQITAPISPGSSGSPVVNIKGEVIGVATFQMVKGQNLNFAIPGERVAKLVLGRKESFAKWEEKREREWSGSAEELYAKGLPFIWAEDYEEALPYFEKAVKKNPRYADAHFQIGYCKLSLGRYQEAIEAFDQMIRFKSDYTGAYINRGTAYLNKGQFDKAILDYNKAIEIDPKKAKPYFGRGLAYSDKGQFDKAISNYNKAIEIDPKEVKPYINRGIVFGKKGQFDKAISDLNKAIEIDPQNVQAYTNRGFVNANKGQFDKAISDLNKAIKINPQYAMAYTNRGFTYTKKGQYDKAISDCTKAIELDPQDAIAYTNRGFTYGKKGQFDKAISDYTKAIEINPQYAIAYANRGLAYGTKGQFDKAISDYNKAIEINPQNGHIYTNRGIVYFIKEEYDNAWNDVNKAKALGGKIHPKFLKALREASGRNR